MRVAASTSLARMLWNVPIGCPNCFRSKRIAARGFVRALRQSDRERRDADAAGVEHLQRVDEALPFDSEQLRRRHAAVLEDDLARLAGPHAELVFLLAGAKPWRAALDDERGDARDCPCARFVTAMTTMRSPSAPWVMNCFVPLITQLSPSRVAVVRIAAASLPDEASVSAPGGELLAGGERRRGSAASAPRCRT